MKSLEAEKTNLKNELSELRGLFKGKRRQEIEARLEQIDIELNKLQM